MRFKNDSALPSEWLYWGIERIETNWCPFDGYCILEQINMYYYKLNNILVINKLQLQFLGKKMKLKFLSSTQGYMKLFWHNHKEILVKDMKNTNITTQNASEYSKFSDCHPALPTMWSAPVHNLSLPLKKWNCCFSLFLRLPPVLKI